MNKKLKQAISILTISGMITGSALLCGCSKEIELDGASLQSILKNSKVKKITTLDTEVKQDNLRKIEIEQAIELEKAIQVQELIKDVDLNQIPLLKNQLTKEEEKETLKLGIEDIEKLVKESNSNTNEDLLIEKRLEAKKKLYAISKHYDNIIENGGEISETMILDAIKGAVADELDITTQDIRITSDGRRVDAAPGVIVKDEDGEPKKYVFSGDMLYNAVDYLYAVQKDGYDNLSDEKRIEKYKESLNYAKKVLLSGASITDNKLKVQNGANTINDEILTKVKKK